MNEVLFLISIFSYIIAVIYLGFIHLFTVIDMNLGIIFGDGEKGTVRTGQAMVTSEIKEFLQGKIFGLIPVIAIFMPTVLFYLSGVNILISIIIFASQVLVDSIFGNILAYKKNIMTFILIDESSMLNRYADYKKNNDEVRAEAMHDVLNVMNDIKKFFNYLSKKNMPLKVGTFPVWARFIKFVYVDNGENLIDRYNSLFMDENELIYLYDSRTSENIVDDFFDFNNRETIMYSPEIILKSSNILNIGTRCLCDIRYFDTNFENDSLKRKADVVAKISNFNNWIEYKKSIEKQKECKKSKFSSLKDELDYYSRKLEYKNFEDLYSNKCKEK